MRKLLAALILVVIAALPAKACGVVSAFACSYACGYSSFTLAVPFVPTYAVAVAPAVVQPTVTVAQPAAVAPVAAAVPAYSAVGAVAVVSPLVVVRHRVVVNRVRVFGVRRFRRLGGGLVNVSVGPGGTGRRVFRNRLAGRRVIGRRRR